MTKEALKLALEALEGADMVDCDMRDAITAIKEALAQPEQEPFMASYEFKQYGYYKDEKGILKLGNIQAAQPPQRTWVGLTDGEVDKMILLMGFPPDWITENAIVKNIVRNLEAKLKEKNG